MIPRTRPDNKLLQVDIKTIAYIYIANQVGIKRINVCTLLHLLILALEFS